MPIMTQKNDFQILYNPDVNLHMRSVTFDEIEFHMVLFNIQL